MNWRGFSRLRGGLSGDQLFAVIILLVLYILNSADRFVIAVVIEPIKHEFGLTDTQLGAVGALAHSIAYSAFVLPIGYLLDRTNRVRLMAGMLAIWSFMTALCSFASGFWMLFLMRMGVGAAEAVSSPGTQTLIASYFPVKQRSSALGVVFSGAAIGTGLAFAAGGAIAAVWGWRSVFLIAGFPGLVVALIMWFKLREPPRQPASTDIGSAPPFLTVLGYFFRNRSVLFIGLGTTIAAMNVATVWVWISPLLIRQQQYSLAEAGVIVGLAAGVVKFLSTLFSGFASDYISRGRLDRMWIVPSTALVLSVPICITLALTTSPALAAVLVLALGLSLGMHLAPPKSVLMTLVPEDMRGSVAAIEQLLVNLIGTAAGPLLTGILSDWLGGKNSVGLALSGVVSLNAVAAVLYWRAMHRLPPVEREETGVKFVAAH